MNILLVKPRWPYPYSRGEHTYNRIWPPLSLMNCASLLENAGCKVMILDAHAQGLRPKKIKNFVKGQDKVFITSSALDRWLCPNIDIAPFLEAARSIREETDELYVMGYHGTVDAQRILALTKAKAIIRGEPEYAVLEICQNRDLFQTKGVTFEYMGKIFSNPDRDLLNLQELPLPAYHLLDFRKYFYEILGGNFALFEIGRGCRFNCSFCNKIMYGEELRKKSRRQIFAEVAQAIEKYKVKSGYFIDLDFLADKEIAESLCDFLIERRYRLKWACQTRPDILNEKILGKMKAAGCRIIHLGVESGRQELLNSMNKNCSLDKIRDAVKLCRQAGIKTLAFFIFGFSDEKREDREETFKFMKEINCDFVSLHKVFAYTGSRIRQGNFNHDREIDKFIRSAIIKYYLRPSLLPNLFSINILKLFELFWGRISTLRGPPLL